MPRKTSAAAVQRADDRALASMRPRPDAAENPRPPTAPARRLRRFNEAAARCRGKPRGISSGRHWSLCFNEAAARCRGKLPAPLAAVVRGLASMRPRPDAAENALLLVEKARLVHDGLQ